MESVQGKNAPPTRRMCAFDERVCETHNGQNQWIKIEIKAECADFRVTKTESTRLSDAKLSRKWIKWIIDALLHHTPTSFSGLVLFVKNVMS